jgi:hypothetical protein
MSKVVKLKQTDIERIVSNIIKENQDLGELQLIGTGGKVPAGTKLVYPAKDDEGNYYIIDAESGEILAKDNPNKGMEDLPMAAE